MKNLGPIILLLLAGATLASGWREEWRWGMVGALFLWAAVLFVIWRKETRFAPGWVLAVAIVLRLILFPLPPVLSDDVYRYLWDGMLTTEGVNPFAHRPADPALARFHDTAMFPLLNSREFFSVYPPSSQVLFAVGGWVYGWKGMWAGVYAIKGLLALCELAALLILARVLTRDKFLLYAWHPVIVLECWGQAHTETIAILGLAFCIWALRRGRAVAAGAALALAGWAKLYPLFFFPFLWRRMGWRVMAAGAAVTALLWLPFLAGFSPFKFKESLDLYVRSFEFNAGPYYALKAVSTGALRLVGMIGPETETSKVVGPVLRGLFLLCAVGLWWRDWKRREGGVGWSFEAASALLLMALLVTMATVHPWYFTLLLVLVLCLKHAFWSWHWLSVVSLGTYLFYSHGLYWPFVWLAWGGWVVLAWRWDRPSAWLGDEAE